MDEQALQGALGGAAPEEAEAPQGGGHEAEELDLLMQIIEAAKATRDPRVMALLEQLVSLQSGGMGEEMPLPEDEEVPVEE